ncbi:peptidoglycan-binding domain-containing protein [Tateyamaria sp.]|uniref:peptidoglycan-binding domain-containing protein n=1 Tax=Tateyamaria sp. TaxID=1929288 RepID=UPI00329C1276
MKYFTYPCVLALSFLGTAAIADPCVSATFDRPLEGATDVVSYVSDVPSAYFPAFWQEGNFDGFKYKMFATAEATVSPMNPNQDWAIELTCDTSEQACASVNTGLPPADAIAVAQDIGQCLLGIENETVAPTLPAPPQQDLANINETAETQALVIQGDITCGSASLNEATDVATMQRLLVMAGQDPGPVDGFLGPRTFLAMETFVTGANWGTSIAKVIALLDARLCEGAT